MAGVDMKHEITWEERLRQQQEDRERLQRWERSIPEVPNTWTGNSLFPNIHLRPHDSTYWTYPREQWIKPKTPEWLDQEYIFDWDPLTITKGGPPMGSDLPTPVIYNHRSANYQPSYQPSWIITDPETHAAFFGRSGG